MLLGCAGLWAQSVFTHINWNGFEIKDQLPELGKTIELGYDYVAEYDVSIEYPEFVEATRSEADMLDLIGAEIGEEVRATTRLGVCQKRGVLDVTLVPVVKRGGKYLKLTSCKIIVTPKGGDGAGMARSKTYDQTESVTDGRYKQNSVLAKGKWAKIRVKDEGVYQLTKQFLASLGFSNMSKVKVYGYGGRVENHVISYGTYTTSDYDDLEEVPLYRRSDALLFFAEGTVRWSNWSLATTANPNGACVATHTNNPYSSYSYYFVTEGDEPLTMNELEVPAATTQTLTTYPEHVVVEKEAYSWYTGGRTFFDSYNFKTGNSVNYTIATPDIDNSYTTQVTVAMSASSTSVTTAKVMMGSTSLGTVTLGAMTSEYEKATTATKQFETTAMLNNNTLNISTTTGRDARLDYIRVCYRRKLKKLDNYLVFSHYTSQPSVFSLTGGNATTEIWRLGYPGNPTAKVRSSLNDGAITFAVSNPTLRYVAVDVNATYPVPEKVGQIANQDLHADSVFDMVIIIPESGKLKEQAQRLADFHKSHDSLRVKVVRADVLYNEFSSGTPDGGAYRRYLKMLYDRNSENDLPKYLLFFGGCLWDNRGVTPACQKVNLKDYLLSYESEPSVSEVSCYVNEDYFGMLDDGEGASLRYEKVDLGIGRFPVTTETDAKVMVDKVIAYASNENPGSWKNAVYFLADDGDKNKHVKEADGAAERVEQYYPNLKVGRIYWDAYKRQTTATGFTYPGAENDINTAVTKGALIMNYTGHGAPYCISKEMVLKTEDFKNFSSPKLPMWVVASCEITPFDRHEENIGVESLINPAGGSIAFLSSSRAVYSTQNSYINNYFMYYVFGNDRQTGKRNTIGDAIRMAKVNLVSQVDGEIISSRDYSDNKLKYALMGDPALTLSMPTQTAVLDSINGVSLNSGNLPKLQAGGMARFSGHLETPDGARINNFNGQVAITLYDSRDTITCYNNQNEDITPFTYYSYDRLLFESNDSIKAGKFSVTMPIPLDIKYSDGAGMVKLYAVSTDKKLEANGTDTRFTIGGTSEDIKPSTDGPKMFIYLNDPDFKDGGKVNNTPYFYANIEDEDGINITGNGVGHDLELIIDGKESTSYNLNAYYQNDFGSYKKGSVTYMIPKLEDGEHSLMFRSWDVKNNSSSQVLKFVVESGLRPNITSVKLSKNPASTSTTFIIAYDRPSTETKFTVNVYNAMGQKCWTKTETATSSTGYHTIQWDLCSNSGVALRSGLYVYEVSISCNGSKQATKKQKLVITRQ